MWLFTEIGFFSIVSNRTDGGKTIMVRARRHEDIHAMAARFREVGEDTPRVHETPGNDYPYRIIVDPVSFAGVMGSLVGDIRYPNFKDHVHKKGSVNYVELLHDVWQRVFDRLDPRAAARSYFNAKPRGKTSR
jgi:hypothetical protein